MILPSTLLLLLSTGIAAAQDQGGTTHHAPSPELGGEELEVQPATALPEPPAALSPVQAPGLLDPDQRFDALMSFRHQHLDIRGSTRWQGGGATVLHGSWGWGPYHGWGWGWGPSVVIRQPLEPDNDWAVYQGVKRLSVPSYLEQVGDQLRLSALEQDIQRTSRNEKIGYGVGGVGAAATVVGFVASAWAESHQELMTWNTVATGGICAAVVGVMAGSSAASRGRRLQTDFRATVAYDDTRAQVDDYNERLRRELGLSKADVYRVLTEQPPRRGQ